MYKIRKNYLEFEQFKRILHQAEISKTEFYKIDTMYITSFNILRRKKEEESGLKL